MLYRINNAIVTFQAIGRTIPGRLSGIPCQVAFSGGLLTEVDVAEDRISSSQPVRSFSFTLPGERLIGVSGIQSLLADYSGPLTITELAATGSVIEAEKVDVIAILYLAVPAIGTINYPGLRSAEIMISGNLSGSSPAKLLSRPLAGCNIRIDEPAGIILNLAEALYGGEVCQIDFR